MSRAALGVETVSHETLELPQGPAEVTFRRSARARRISLRVDARSGRVVVTLPLRAGRNAATALLMTHAGWVTEQLAALPDALAIADGAVLPLHDAPVVVRHRPDARGTWVADGCLHVSGQPDFLRRRVLDFLRAEARRTLLPMTAAKCAQAGLTHGRVTIRDTKSRWGSCASDGALSFCWRLVLAPGWVQDYVVAHEVAHLAHMNHGPKFWALVRTLTPHTTAAMAWLHGNGARLLRIG